MADVPENTHGPNPFTQRIAELEADKDEMLGGLERMDAENAKLKEAARQYLLGGHNADCELYGFVQAGQEDKDPLECDCGYDALAALVEK